MKAFTVLIYALIGYLSRTIQVDAYYVAGRQVPTVFNGMATAAAVAIPLNTVGTCLPAT